MFLIERLSSKIASKISFVLDLDKAKEEVIAYGAFSTLQMLWCIFLVIVFGFIFGVLRMSLIISFTIALLRKYSGGVHASTPNKCAFIGTVICVGFALIIKYLFSFIYPTVSIFIGVGVYILCFYLVYKLAPIASPKKPIVKLEKIKRLKHYSISVLSFFLFISILLLLLYSKYKESYFLDSLTCIYIGMAWQVFTLTQFGHKTLELLDNVLK